MPKHGCLRLLIITCCGGLLLCVVAVIAIQMQRTYWIAPYEKRFASNLATPPTVLSIDTFAPTQIDGFQRISTLTDSGNHAPSLSATYAGADALYNVQITILRLPASFDKAQFFQLANWSPDGIGGWTYVNLNAAHPFSYGSSITFSDHFMGITWINGEYALHISGDRQSIDEFLSDYPY